MLCPRKRSFYICRHSHGSVSSAETLAAVISVVDWWPTRCLANELRNRLSNASHGVLIKCRFPINPYRSIWSRLLLKTLFLPWLHLKYSHRGISSMLMVSLFQISPQNRIVQLKTLLVKAYSYIHSFERVLKDPCVHIFYATLIRCFRKLYQVSMKPLKMEQVDTSFWW